jgi:hypothetical protein
VVQNFNLRDRRIYRSADNGSEREFSPPRSCLLCSQLCKSSVPKLGAREPRGCGAAKSQPESVARAVLSVLKRNALGWI